VSQTYKVFKRSAKNWEEFGSSQKTTIRRGLTLAEARQMCKEFNENRTTTQINAGTKLEFTAE
jgi:hypothetical protein